MGTPEIGFPRQPEWSFLVDGGRRVFPEEKTIEASGDRLCREYLTDENWQVLYRDNEGEDKAIVRKMKDQLWLVGDSPNLGTCYDWKSGRLMSAFFDLGDILDRIGDIEDDDFYYLSKLAEKGKVLRLFVQNREDRPPFWVLWKVVKKTYQSEAIASGFVEPPSVGWLPGYPLYFWEGRMGGLKQKFVIRVEEDWMMAGFISEKDELMRGVRVRKMVKREFAHLLGIGEMYLTLDNLEKALKCASPSLEIDV